MIAGMMAERPVVGTFSDMVTRVRAVRLAVVLTVIPATLPGLLGIAGLIPVELQGCAENLNGRPCDGQMRDVLWNPDVQIAVMQDVSDRLRNVVALDPPAYHQAMTFLNAVHIKVYGWIQTYGNVI
jgi:hypothetical protein